MAQTTRLASFGPILVIANPSCYVEGPALAFVGRRWVLWAFVGLRWPSVGCCGPALAVVGCAGPSWACVGLRWLLWAFVDLRWPALAFVGLRWPLLSPGDGAGLLVKLLVSKIITRRNKIKKST